jgi:ABC-type nitrate/sulfonate/bicarbonate transport system permease component
MSTVASRERVRKYPGGFGFKLPFANLGPSLLALGIGAGFWELIGQLANFQFFPPLSAVIARMFTMIAAGQIIAPLVGSLTNLALGLGFAVVVGVTLGLLMGAYRKVDAALDVYVYALLTAPSLVFAPILFSIFGLGREPIVGIIILYSIFIIIINTAAAVRSVPLPLLEMARSYSASDWQLFRRIILPSATPLIMAGIRLGSGRAVKGMINGEMFIAAVGLGAVVMRAGSRFDSESVLAVLIVIIIVAFMVVWLVQFIDRRLTSWLPETQRKKR